MIEQVRSYVERLLTVDNIVQVGVVVIVILAAIGLHRFVRRYLPRLQAGLENWPYLHRVPWLLELFLALEAALLPLIMWALGRAAAPLVASLGRSTGLIEWITPFFGLWAIYRAAALLIARNLKPAQVRLWLSILRLVILALAFLQSVDLVDNILSISFQAGSNILITLRSFLLGIGAFVLFFVLSRTIRQLLRDDVLPRTGVDPSLNQVISSFTGYGLIVAGFLIALNLMGISLTTVTVIAGGLSVGIGFGLQELINNFISGFILLTERSVAPGDVIEVDDQIGIVGQINLRTMQIRTADSIDLVVPNGHLLQNVLTSYTRGDKRLRIHIPAVASLSANPHEALAALLEAAEHPLLLRDPAPRALFTGFGDNALEFDLEVWTEEPLEIPNISSDLRLRIWDAFQTRGVELPPPEN